MNVSVKHLLACAILLAISHSIRADYDVDAYCTLVKNNVRLGSVDDCETYYTCNNGVATKGTCPPSQAFDKNAQGCRPKSDVQCFLGNENPCQLKNEGFVPVVGTCNAYIYCRNYAEAGRGYCPNGQIFSQGNCVFGDCNDNINEGNEGLNSVCEIMPDNIFFGSTKDCKIWQRCTTGQLSSGNCASQFVFDVQIQQCNYESGNMCSRVTGQDIQPDPTPTRPCGPADEKKIDPDTATCSVYYVCKGSKWVQNKCGQGLYFSVLTQKCELRQYATPSANCDRCEFSKKQFVNAVDPECRQYQICENGKKKGKTGSCDTNSYFNEASQACILDTDGMSEYSLKNGACFNCDAKCGSLSGASCKVTGACNCGLDTDKECVVCPGISNAQGECDDAPPAPCGPICSPLKGAACIVTDHCNCGLDTAGDCVECSDTPNAQGKCDDVPPAPCGPICSPLVGAACIVTDHCNCGLDTAGDCVECPDKPNAQGKCDDGPDCAVECGKKPLNDCNVTDCDCDINEGKCADCKNPANCKCECGDPDCVSGDGADCGCFEKNNKCEYCPLGLDDPLNPQACNPPP